MGLPYITQLGVNGFRTVQIQMELSLLVNHRKSKIGRKRVKVFDSPQNTYHKLPGWHQYLNLDPDHGHGIRSQDQGHFIVFYEYSVFHRTDAHRYCQRVDTIRIGF